MAGVPRKPLRIGPIRRAAAAEPGAAHIAAGHPRSILRVRPE